MTSAQAVPICGNEALSIRDRVRHIWGAWENASPLDCRWLVRVCCARFLTDQIEPEAWTRDQVQDYLLGQGPNVMPWAGEVLGYGLVPFRGRPKGFWRGLWARVSQR